MINENLSLARDQLTSRHKGGHLLALFTRRVAKAEGLNTLINSLTAMTKYFI